MEYYDILLSCDNSNESIRSVAIAVCNNLNKLNINAIILTNKSPKEQIASIKNCKAMVLIYSSSANTSEQVLSDVDSAFAFGTPIVPFMIDSSPMDDELRYYLSRKHFLVAYPEWQTKIPELANTLRIFTGEANDKEVRLANLKIIPDDNCKLYIDGEYRDKLIQSRPYIMPLASGKYDIIFVSSETRFFKVEYKNYYFRGRDTVLRPKFAPIRKQAEKEKLERYAYYRSFYANEDSCGGMTRLFGGNGYLFLNKYGFPISDKPFSDSVTFSQGLCAVARKDKWGMINCDGDIIVPFKYDGSHGNWPQIFGQKIIVSAKDGSKGCLRMDGSQFIPCSFFDVDPGMGGSHGAITLAERDGKYGYYDENGCKTIDNIHSSLYYSSDEINLIVDNNSVYEFSGKCLYYTEEFNVCDADTSYAVIVKNGKYGFARMRDRTVIIEPEYDFAMPFSERLAAVAIGDDLGFINIDNRFEIEPIYRLKDKSWHHSLKGRPEYNFFIDGEAVVYSSLGNYVKIKHPDKRFHKQ